MKKRVISIVLSVMLLLALVPLSSTPARAAVSGEILIENLPDSFPTPILSGDDPAEIKENDLKTFGYYWEGQAPP